MSVPELDLNNGNKIPQIGLGLWKVKDKAEFLSAFKAAYKTGYRHFDTAQVYGNEQYLGEAWKSNHVDRNEIFITTKINIVHFAPSKLHLTFEESLDKLNTDYVDLLLLHFPVPLLRKKAWAALEDLNTSGLAKNIGVSNYTIEHLEEMKAYAKIMPSVNQVELHVFLQQPELVQYCKKQHIRIEAYSPLGHANIMNNETVLELAEKHNKSYAQIMLRFLLDQDLVVIPKSVNPKRIEENFNVFDFKLDSNDTKRLKAQDLNKHFCWSPNHVP